MKLKSALSIIDELWEKRSVIKKNEVEYVEYPHYAPLTGNNRRAILRASSDAVDAFQYGIMDLINDPTVKKLEFKNYVLSCLRYYDCIQG
jgi:hypothetical protein